MNENQKYTLKSIVRFGPLSLGELKQLVPELKAYDVEIAVEELTARGFVQHADEERRESNYNRVYDDEVVQVNTNPFKTPTDDQQSLTGNSPDAGAVIQAGLPDEVVVEEELSLELTEDQTELFERMRTDVSRTCGTMDREEFMDWVLREARRMTEV